MRVFDWFTKSRKRREAEKAAKAVDGLKEIKKQVEDAPSVSPAPVVAQEGTTQTQGEVKSLEEFPIGQKLGIEITRIVEGTTKRVTIAKGRVAIKSGARPVKLAKLLFFVWQKGAQYYINPKKIIKVTTTRKGKQVITFKLVYDILIGEALNQDGTVEWDDDLEMILADSGLDQYVTIAAFEGGFQFTPTLVKVFFLVGALGLLFGMALNGSFHFIPTTEIHWVP